jgi:hypothetical protein
MELTSVNQYLRPVGILLSTSPGAHMTLSNESP